MSEWDDTIFSIGDRVMTDINELGVITNIRRDDVGEQIFTISLDNGILATPDGLYVARDFELRRLS